ATKAADDPFGDSSEPAGPGTSADGAASGAAGAAAAAGPGADASFASAGPEPLLAPSSAVSMTAISALFGTVAPSSARISFRTPSNRDGTSALTLSVIASGSGSCLSTWSPGCLSHLPIVPSATLSPSWGIVTFATFAVPPRGGLALGASGSRTPHSAHAARA